MGRARVCLGKHAFPLRRAGLINPFSTSLAPLLVQVGSSGQS